MDNDHIVKSFDEELVRLDQMIAEMGGLAEAQMTDALEALTSNNPELAEKVVARDKRIDALEEDVDKAAVRILALRQPMAADLRVILTALKVASNLERIGDYSKNIAKRVVTLSRMQPVGTAVRTVNTMSELVQEMIRNVLDAYLNRDDKLASDVRKRDQEVDEIHTGLFRELLTYMMEDARNISAATHFLFIAKNVERIGDHVTSIAEQVHFVVHGEQPDDDRPKNDQSAFATVEPTKPA